MAQDDMVWVDDGQGPIVACWAKGPNSPLMFMREPKQIKASEVGPGINVLDEKMLKIYRDNIERVKKRRK